MSSIKAFKNAVEGLILATNQSKKNSKTFLSQIHDPISTLVRFSLLPLMPKGTRLNILNHKITFRSPYCQQPYVLRYSAQDDYHWTPEEFHLLQKPMEKAVQWFGSKPFITNLFEMAINGILGCRLIYENKSKDSHIELTNLLNTLQKAVIQKTHQKNEDFFKLDINQKIDKKSNQAYSLINENLNSEDIFLKNLWSDEEIWAVNRLLINAEGKFKEIKNEKKNKIHLKSLFQSTLGSIEVILQSKDQQLECYLKLQR